MLEIKHSSLIFTFWKQLEHQTLGFTGDTPVLALKIS